MECVDCILILIIFWILWIVFTSEDTENYVSSNIQAERQIKTRIYGDYYDFSDKMNIRKALTLIPDPTDSRLVIINNYVTNSKYTVMQDLLTNGRPIIVKQEGGIVWLIKYDVNTCSIYGGMGNFNNLSTVKYNSQVYKLNCDSINTIPRLDTTPIQPWINPTIGA